MYLRKELSINYYLLNFNIFKILGKNNTKLDKITPLTFIKVRGLLAQLVERYLDKVDVGSSSLPGTTIN